MHGKYEEEQKSYFSMNIDHKRKSGTNDEITRLLFIDSRDLINTLGYKSAFDFVVKLEDRTSTQQGETMVYEGVGIEPYKNVTKFELKMIGIPKMNNNEHYVILDIPEINDHLDSTDKNGSHKASAIINYATGVLPGQVVSTIENFEFAFTAPLQALSQFQVKLFKHKGVSISDTDFATLNYEDIYTTMMFEVTYNPLK